jgi:hypothetical protein
MSGSGDAVLGCPPHASLIDSPSGAGLARCCPAIREQEPGTANRVNSVPMLFRASVPRPGTKGGWPGSYVPWSGRRA